MLHVRSPRYWIPCAVVLGAGLLVLWLTSRHYRTDAEELAAGVEEVATIVFDTVRIDLGDVPVGAKQTVSFRYVNNLPAPVELTKFHTVCACTASVELDKTPVPTGGAGTIKILFEPRIGPNAWPLLAEFSNRQQIRLELRAYAYTDAFLSKTAVYFPLTAKGKTQAGSLEVMADRKMASDVSVSIPTALPSWLKATILDADRAPEKDKEEGNQDFDRAPWRRLAKVRIEIMPNAPVGRFAIPLGLGVKDRRGSRRLAFTCTGEVAEDVSVVPGALVILSKKGYEREITVRSIAEPFTLLDATSELLECKVQGPSQASKEAQIRVKLNESRGGKREGQVRIKIAHPTVSEINVPVKLLGR
jgi:uncharacterized protein DUF1573